MKGSDDDVETFHALRRELGDARPSAPLPGDPAVALRAGHRATWTNLPAPGARVIVEKPFGRDLAVGQRAQRHGPPGLRRALDLPDRPLPGQGRSRTCSTSGSPTRCSSRSGTAIRASVQITMAEAFDVAGRGAFYDQAGAIRDVVQNHLLAGRRPHLVMEPPSGRQPEASAMRSSRCWIRSGRFEPAGRGPRPVPRLSQGRGRPRLDGRDLRGAPPAPRHLALGRGAVLHPGGQGLPVTATEVLVELRQPPQTVFRRG